MVFFNTMRSRKLLFPVVAFALLSFQAHAQETTLQGEPFGYVKVSIPGAANNAKSFTIISLPLLEEADITGTSSGVITALTSNTITSQGAGWSSGELTQVAAPYLVEITSGQAAGRMFLISSSQANTEDTVQVQDADGIALDLTVLGINAGEDTFKIRPVDTLASFFGSPGDTGIEGGTNARTADVVTLGKGALLINAYYDTTLGRWTEATRSFADASHTPLMPHSALQYARAGEMPLDFIVTGKVPSGPRRQPIKNLGATFLAQYWPVSTTLEETGLADMPGWRKDTNIKLADRVVIFGSDGQVSTHYHNGTEWRLATRAGAASGSTVLGTGKGVVLNKIGSLDGETFSLLEQQPPYSLE